MLLRLNEANIKGNLPKTQRVTGHLSFFKAPNPLPLPRPPHYSPQYTSILPKNVRLPSCHCCSHSEALLPQAHLLGCLGNRLGHHCVLANGLGTAQPPRPWPCAPGWNPRNPVVRTTQTMESSIGVFISLWEECLVWVLISFFSPPERPSLMCSTSALFHLASASESSFYSVPDFL